MMIGYGTFPVVGAGTRFTSSCAPTRPCGVRKMALRIESNHILHSLVDHPNIVRAFDCIDDVKNKMVTISMEYGGVDILTKMVPETQWFSVDCSNSRPPSATCTRRCTSPIGTSSSRTSSWTIVAGCGSSTLAYLVADASNAVGTRFCRDQTGSAAYMGPTMCA